ncbi:unnamed protein product [Closterium sp. NIES-54]
MPVLTCRAEERRNGGEIMGGVLVWLGLGTSLSTLLNCATTASAPTACADCTPRVFCAVTAVIAVAHHTPCAALDLISAWIPAPPPESDPAIVNTTGRGAGAGAGSGAEGAAAVSGAAHRAGVGRG